MGCVCFFSFLLFGTQVSNERNKAHNTNCTGYYTLINSLPIKWVSLHCVLKWKSMCNLNMIYMAHISVVCTIFFFGGGGQNES